MSILNKRQADNFFNHTALVKQIRPCGQKKKCTKNNKRLTHILSIYFSKLHDCINKTFLSDIYISVNKIIVTNRLQKKIQP